MLKTLQPSVISHFKFDKHLSQWVKEWILCHTVPSSNTHNIINYKQPDDTKAHTVVHWCMSTLELDGVNSGFSKLFFYNNILLYVCIKKIQDVCMIQAPSMNMSLQKSSFPGTRSASAHARTAIQPLENVTMTRILTLKYAVSLLATAARTTIVQ